MKPFDLFTYFKKADEVVAQVLYFEQALFSDHSPKQSKRITSKSQMKPFQGCGNARRVWLSVLVFKAFGFSQLSLLQRFGGRRSSKPNFTIGEGDSLETKLLRNCF
jgi:hypothetical protein